jgi:hypothetical protein
MRITPQRALEDRPVRPRRRPRSKSVAPALRCGPAPEPDLQPRPRLPTARHHIQSPNARTYARTHARNGSRGSITSSWLTFAQQRLLQPAMRKEYNRRHSYSFSRSVASARVLTERVSSHTTLTFAQQRLLQPARLARRRPAGNRLDGHHRARDAPPRVIPVRMYIS